MKGIVIAAGKGSRLGEPNKALVDINGRPLVTYPLDNLAKLGIDHTTIVQHENDICERLGDSYNGMALDYATQLERKGIAHALGLTEDLLGENLCVILGDIYYRGDLDYMKKVFDHFAYDAVCGMVRTSDNNDIKKAYGIDDNGRFLEKPENVRGLVNLVGTGIYMFTPEVYKKIRELVPKNGELQITDLLNLGKTYACQLGGNYLNINTQEDLKMARHFDSLEKAGRILR